MARTVLGTGNKCTICERLRPKREKIVSKYSKNGTYGVYMYTYKKCLYLCTMINPTFRDNYPIVCLQKVFPFAFWDTILEVCSRPWYEACHAYI